jgi:hypothetical protein
LRVGNLSVGNTSTGSAQGTLQLQSANLEANNVFAGSGAGGVGFVSLRDATATIANDFTLTNGDLSLDDSLLTVANAFTLGAGATLSIDIDGLLRGSEYGAIDAGLASLAGILSIDLTDLAFAGDTFVFDLLRTGGVDGISGDFGSLLLTGLQGGFAAVAGVELDGVEIYRLRLTRQTVPEPATWTLLLSCLVAALMRRRLAPTAPPR